MSFSLKINAICILGTGISRPLAGFEGWFVGLGVTTTSLVGFAVGDHLEGNSDGSHFEVTSIVGCVVRAPLDGDWDEFHVGIDVGNSVGVFVGGAVGLRVNGAVG